MAGRPTTYFANLGISPGPQDTFSLSLCTFAKGQPHVVVTRRELAMIGENMIRLAGNLPADDEDDGMDLV